MHSSISSMIQKIWTKFRNKSYRDSFVAAHISNTVAAQIALLRSENGWNQTKLARKAKLYQSQISKYEDPNFENIEIKTLRKFASAFDVALSVRFIPFSELAKWGATMSPAGFAVPSFAHDSIDFDKNRTETDAKVISMFQRAPAPAGNVHLLLQADDRPANDNPTTNPAAVMVIT